MSHLRTAGAFRKSTLRRANEKLVLDSIRQHPSLSRADLVRLTGLSPSSVTFIINRLLRERMVEELDQGETSKAQVGRQPTPLRLRSAARLVVAVEIGRIHSRVVLANWCGEIIQTRNVPWNVSPTVYLQRMRSTIQSLISGYDLKTIIGVGLAVGGTIHQRTGRVIAAENLGWFGIDVLGILKQDLPIPFHWDNEARLCALAEVWFGEPEQKRLRNFVFLTVPEGVGTGVLADGHFLHGAAGAGGEFGHIMLDPNGPPCVCGNRGCWEQYVSPRALEQRYATLSNADSKETATADRIVDLARSGEPAARQALVETAKYVGLGLVNLIVALNPEAIVFGDYLARAWDLIEETIWREVRQRTPSYYLPQLMMRPSRHGDDAAVKGAIALVLSDYFSRIHDTPSVEAEHASAAV